MLANEFVSFDKYPSNTARRYAAIALAVFLISECASIIIFNATRGSSYLEIVILISLKSLVFWWILPLLIVYKVEHRDIKSLGLVIPPGKKRLEFY